MKSILWLAAALALSGCQRAAPPAPVAAPTAEAAINAPEQTIVALGDSLFAGYGLASIKLSYPAKLEAALRRRGINAHIVNAGVSGDTTADGLARADFALNSLPHSPALVVISLGGNDMLRSLPPAQTRANLDALLGKLEGRKIPVVMLGMLAAPNLGADYAAAFNPAYPALAKKHHAALVPFFLGPLLGHPELVQADHIHPTEQGVNVLVAATLNQVAAQLPKLS